MRTSREYLIAVQQSLQISQGNSEIYAGKDGALRLAREIGACLNDFTPAEAYEAFRDSYNYVCVIGYSLKPPVDAGEWNDAVKTKMEAEK